MKKGLCFFIFILVMNFNFALAQTKVSRITERAEKGDSQAQYELALMYEYGNDVKKNVNEALKWYQRAAENGHAGAQTDLGWFYQNGEYVEKNIQKAMDFYMQSADQGNAQAQLNIAVLYDEGMDIPENNKLAIKWYELAAKQGHPSAQLNLGISYWKGEGVEQDYQKAWDLLNQVRMTSSDKRAEWKARDALDQIKKELGVDEKFKKFSYPSWEKIKLKM